MQIVNFKKLKMSKDDRLKYFKEETWGTSDIFVSGGKAQRSVGVKTLIKRTRELIGNAESGNSNAKRMDFMTKVMTEMANGSTGAAKSRRRSTIFARKVCWER